MPVDHLSIRGFRSYRELDVDFPGGPQVVVGHNAAGKTNLLEAMVVLSQGSSHGTHQPVVAKGRLTPDDC